MSKCNFSYQFPVWLFSVCEFISFNILFCLICLICQYLSSYWQFVLVYLRIDNNGLYTALFSKRASVQISVHKVFFKVVIKCNFLLRIRFEIQNPRIVDVKNLQTWTKKCATIMPELVNLHDCAAADLGQVLPVLAHVQQVLRPYIYAEISLDVSYWVSQK